MIMSFPMDNSDRFSSAGGHTGAPLQHCVDNLNEPQDVPFPKHYPNQPGRITIFILLILLQNNIKYTT